LKPLKIQQVRTPSVSKVLSKFQPP